MMQIPVKQVPCVDGNGNASTMLMPSSTPPADRIYMTCDGTNYTVYEPGDALPDGAES
jgi:hypothetical protein